MDTYTVSQLNEEVEKTLYKDFKNKLITVKGEISNFKKSNGHYYISLKDINSQINVIFWNCSIDNKHGDNVVISGRLELYKKSGTLNIIGKSITLLGIGEINEEYKKMYDYYEKKGYFNINNKIPIPEIVNNVGILCANNSAALADLLHVLKNSCLNIFLYNTIVQGENASKSISNGLKFFNDNKNMVDIILISRGGGSKEDLICFSHKNVIEAIHESKICVLTGIAHDNDSVIADHVASLYFSTPSCAGMYIAKKYSKIELLNDLEINTILPFKNKIMKYLNSYKATLKKISNYTKNFFELINKFDNILLNL